MFVQGRKTNNTQFMNIVNIWISWLTYSYNNHKKCFTVKYSYFWSDYDWLHVLKPGERSLSQLIIKWSSSNSNTFIYTSLFVIRIDHHINRKTMLKPPLMISTKNGPVRPQTIGFLQLLSGHLSTNLLGNSN